MSTRDTIVTTARRAFYMHGYEHTSLADLAAAAGVPKGNFYYHFKSKDDVLRAVLDARKASIQARLEAWRAEIETPVGRLERMVAMLTHDREDLVAYGCPTGSLLTELGKARGDLKEGAREIMELFVEFAALQFRELGQTPAVARASAQHLFGRAQGAVLVAHAYGDTKLLEREIASLRQWLESVPVLPRKRRR